MAEASFTLKAVDATKAAFASVQNSLAKLQNSSETAAGFMKKAFDPKAIGAGLAASLGVSLVGVIDMAVTKLIELAMRAGEVRKILAESSKEILKMREDAAFAELDPQGQIAAIDEKRKKNAAEILRLTEATKEIENVGVSPTGDPMALPSTQFGAIKEAEQLRKIRAEDTALEIDRRKLSIALEKQSLEDKLNGYKAIQDFEQQIADIQEKAFEEIEKQRESEQDRRIAALKAGLAEGEKNTPEIIKAQLEKNEAITKEREALEKLAQSYRDLNSPSQVFIRQIDEVNKVAASGTLGFGFADAALSVDLLTIAMKKNEATRMDAALNDLFGDLDEEAKRIENLTKQMSALESVSMDAGAMIAQGFEDAILSGQKLGEVVRALGQDLLRLIFRQQITAPLAKGIGDALFAGFRAEGGPVGAGGAYVVGEKGPELFVPRSSGSIVPSGAMGSSGGGSGGVTVNYNIAAGVSRSELVPILEQERRRLKAEIPDMVRRGGSYRSAFA
jgi:predicted  nucleic acid-binding Zn-ribbon protein